MNGTALWQMTDIAVLSIRFVIDLDPTSENPTFLFNAHRPVMWSLLEVYSSRASIYSKPEFTFI